MVWNQVAFTGIHVDIHQMFMLLILFEKYLWKPLDIDMFNMDADTWLIAISKMNWLLTDIVFCWKPSPHMGKCRNVTVHHTAYTKKWNETKRYENSQSNCHWDAISNQFRLINVKLNFGTNCKYYLSCFSYLFPAKYILNMHKTLSCVRAMESVWRVTFLLHLIVSQRP